MNHYFNRIGSWTGDGSEGGTMVIEKNETDPTSTKVELASASKGTPTSAYFRLDDEDSEPATHPTCYFEVKVVSLEGHLAVGLVQPQEVLPGWRTKGMFYNGNLTNGSAALQASFGEPVKQGHTVGIYCVAQPEGTQVYVYMNGQCLGMAFSLPAVTNATQPKLRVPCLHVSGKTTVEVSMPDRLPTVLERASGSEGGLSGDWMLVSIKVGPDVGEYHFEPTTTFVSSMSALDAKSFRWSLKIQNSLSTKLRIGDAEGNATKTDDGWEDISVGVVRSTRMRASPPNQALESALCENLPKLTRLQRQPGNTLLLKGPDAEVTLKRHVKVFDPLKKY